jgi:hypothetical protein
MKKCIFCDSLITKATQSKEHVIPKWILDKLEPGYTYNNTGKWTTFPTNTEVIFSERKYSSYSTVLGGVCKKCNGGWMSDLETQFQPLFNALYEEESPVIFTKEQSIIFAKWAFKTSITLNYSANYKKIIPIEHIHYFYRNKDMPPNMKVDIAFCEKEGLHQLIGGNKLSIIPDSYKNGKELIEKSYIATFQFDHLLIRLSWTPDPRLQVRNISSNTVYRVHPIEDKDLLIQYVKDEVFKDISHFHFFSTIIVEDSIVERTPDFNKVIQNLQNFRSKNSF